MELKWSSTWSTGIEWQDKQHRELFDKTVLLINAVKNGEGPAQVEDLLRFLEGYIIDHFRLEEKQMVMYGFSGYKLHKEQHKLFIAKFHSIKSDFDKRGYQSSILMELQIFVINWFVQHFGKLDKELANFLTERNVPESS